MEFTPENEQPGPRWMSRLVEVLQPLSVRADRLGSVKLFAGLPWPDLEHAARCFSETLVERGTRMTVQGHPSSRLWLIMHGDALVSTDARPVRVAGRGDVVGGATMLFRIESHETTIALTAISAFEAGPEQVRMLMGHPEIRRRIAGISAVKRRATRRSSAGG